MKTEPVFITASPHHDLFVCLSTGLHKSYTTDLHQTLWRDVASEEPTEFWDPSKPGTIKVSLLSLKSAVVLFSLDGSLWFLGALVYMWRSCER